MPSKSARIDGVKVKASVILEEAYKALEAKHYTAVTPRLAQVLKAVPNHPVALLLAGMLAVELGQGKKVPHNGSMKDAVELAGEWIDRAMTMAGDVPWPAAHSFMALVLSRQGRFEEAAQAAQRAIDMGADKPMPEAYNNLGNALYGAGRYDDALKAYDQGSQLRLGMPSIRFNRSLIHLIRGDYRKGFELYEARWNIKEWNRDHGRPFHDTHPQWHGGPLEQKTLLLTYEQGHGDVIQQLRYIPWVLSRNPKRLILEVHQPLVRLVRERLPNAKDCEILALGDDLPTFDTWCPMMSLCGVHGTTTDTIPPAPYLLKRNTPKGNHSLLPGGYPAESAAAFHVKHHLNVCFAWAGSPSHHRDFRRSTHLDHWRPLWDIPGIHWWSIQVGPRQADLVRCPPHVTDMTTEIQDFEDTARLMELADLVISVDTAVAHLAGALGIPLRLLSATPGDWRWGEHGAPPPWYNLTLYRQSIPGDWQHVFTRLHHDLITLTQTNRVAQTPQ